MTNEQRHAHELYFQTQLTQQQIADMVNIDRKTLYLWIKEGGWKQAKYAAEHAPSVLIEQYYEQLGAMNNHIASRAEQPWPSKEETVIIRNITTTIKNIRNGKHTVGESVEVFQHFTDKLRRKDLSLTKEVLPHMTRHIKDLSEEGKWLNFSQLRFEQEAFDKEYEAYAARQQQEAETNPNSQSPIPNSIETNSQTTPPSPLERACPVPSAGAGVISLAQGVTPPSPLERAGERSLAQGTNPNPNSKPPIPNSIETKNGASMGNSQISENPSKPLPMAENKINDIIDLPAETNENVDNANPEIADTEPYQNTVEDAEDEYNDDLEQTPVLYPNDRWGQFLEDRYNISQDPYITRKNGITVIKSGSPLWQRGRARSLFF